VKLLCKDVKEKRPASRGAAITPRVNDVSCLQSLKRTEERTVSGLGGATLEKEAVPAQGEKSRGRRFGKEHRRVLYLVAKGASRTKEVILTKAPPGGGVKAQDDRRYIASLATREEGEKAGKGCTSSC